MASIDDEEPISLEAEDSLDTEGKTAKPGALKAFGSGSAHAAVKTDFKRQPTVNGTGALRCKFFHSKVAVASLDYMVNQINGWLDTQNIEVKHVGHLVGTMEGKIPEPNVIVMVWY